MNEDNKPLRIMKSAVQGVGFREDLVDEPYLNWLRCSTDHQSDTSPDGQKDWNDTYAAMNKMRWVGEDVFAEGVSGSQTFNREDVKTLLEVCNRTGTRKVIVYELGRATRGGVRHGNDLDTQLRRAGVELISSTEQIPKGPIGDLIKSVKHFSNQQQALNLSSAVARGLAQSLARNERPSASRTPYGLARLYLGPDRTKRALIYWEGLTQVRVDPNTMEEVSRTQRPPSRQKRKTGERMKSRTPFRGYIKQVDETSMLVSGPANTADAVRMIYHMYFEEDLGPHRIVIELRKRGVPSLTGMLNWTIGTVNTILRNPIYVGIEVRNRFTSALYNMVGKDGAIPVTVDQDRLEAEGRVAIPQTVRARSEWVLTDVPALKEFLPIVVRQKAIAYFLKLLDADRVVAKQMLKANRKNKADSNPHVLSRIITSKQTKMPMSGATHRSKKRPVYRRYFDLFAREHAINGTLIRSVRADHLEDAIVPAVFSVLQDRSWMDERVRSAMRMVDAPVQNSQGKVAALETERSEVNRRLVRVHKTSGHLSDDDLAALVRDDNERLSAIRRELLDLQSTSLEALPTVDEAVASVRARLDTLPEDWKSVPPADLKRLLRVVFEKLEVDLETFEIEAKLRVPKMAMIPPFEIAAGDHLSFTSAWPSELELKAADAIEIAEIRCERVVKSLQKQCYVCRRLPRAA